MQRYEKTNNNYEKTATFFAAVPIFLMILFYVVVYIQQYEAITHAFCNSQAT